MWNDNLPEGAAHDPRAPWNMPDLQGEPIMCALCYRNNEAVATAVVEGKRVAVCKPCVADDDFEGTDVKHYD